MFIVAMTLSMLAAMGIYGLSATSMDIRSAGHVREALQAQRAGEHALIATAETFNPATATGLVATMMGGSGKQTTTCKTAAPFTGNAETRSSEACLRLVLCDPAEPSCTSREMDQIAKLVNAWPTTGAYSGASFGPAPPAPFAQLYPFVRVEITNPVDVPPPPGSGTDPTQSRFSQVTVTVFTELRATLTSPAQSSITGRGRLTVGPIQGAPAKY
jgi:hypothetical protein